MSTSRRPDRDQIVRIDVSERAVRPFLSDTRKSEQWALAQSSAKTDTVLCANGAWHLVPRPLFIPPFRALEIGS